MLTSPNGFTSQATTLVVLQCMCTAVNTTEVRAHIGARFEFLHVQAGTIHVRRAAIIWLHREYVGGVARERRAMGWSRLSVGGETHSRGG